jgi:hypothetical protein
MSKASQEREQKVYDLYMAGYRYKNIVALIGDEMTESGIKQALQRYRKRNNLPNGRKERKEY